MTRFEEAKAAYAQVGVDVEAAIARLEKIPVSMHCWQGDDVKGFLSDGELSGGIQTTGNYPYRARTFEELTADLDFAFSLIPGKKRLNLHAIYAVLTEKKDVDELTIDDFAPWLNWARERGIGLDFNPTLFSHPMVKDGLTLSSPDESVRKFWIKHVKACRKIAAQIGKAQGSPCLNNLWIPDGLKDVPGNRLAPRMRLKASLDEIYADKYPSEYIIDSVESKVFGIGVESYTVGSSEFYMNYAALNGMCCLLDNGHYHPTEVVSDKIPSMLAFFDKVALHVTRGVRWDSDHVVVFEDELKEIAKEIIRNNADERVLIGLDYFDASINRVMAWVVGMRNMQKALLWALLLPNEQTTLLQDEGRFTELMYLNEKMKTYPFGDVWNEYLTRNNLTVDYLDKIQDYEKELKKSR